jgi:hypothetical protein
MPSPDEEAGDYYTAAHGWGSPAIFRSYAMAWTAQADFKLQAHLSLPGGIRQFKTARPCKAPTRRQADLLLSSTTPQVQSFRPPAIPRYLAHQFKRLGIPELTDHSHWQSLLPPTTTAYSLGSMEVTSTTPTPESEVPSVLTENPSVHSSLGSTATGTADDKRNYDSREKTLRLVSTSKMYAFPTDPGLFFRWESVTETELLSPPWCLDGTTIMRQPTTTPANAAISRHFASYLQRCALQGGEKISRNLISGIQAKKDISLGQACELFRLILKTYKPVGPRWLWDYDLQWGDLKQAKGESPQELSGRISELEDKLRDCGLQFPELAHKLKLVTCVCRGFYHNIYTDVYDKICVRQEQGWDLQILDLETLVNCLTSLLCNSQYWGQGSLKSGAYPKKKQKPPHAASRMTQLLLLTGVHSSTSNPRKPWSLSVRFAVSSAGPTLTVSDPAPTQRNTDWPSLIVQTTPPEATGAVPLPTVPLTPRPSLHHPTSHQR